MDRLTYEFVEVDVEDEFGRTYRQLRLKALADSPVFDASTGQERPTIGLYPEEVLVLVIVGALIRLYAALPPQDALRALLQLFLELLLAR